MRKWVFRFAWMALGIGALYAASALAGVVSGGSLDPPGPPGSTMKSLDDISGIWDKQLVADDGSACNSSRFSCVMLKVQCTPNCFFTYEGVLDRETGLVWQRDPSTNTSAQWGGATGACYGVRLGDRAGWRPATAAELMSLTDFTQVSPTPSLPPGNPFQNVAAGGGTYWSSTEVPGDPSSAYSVSFVGGLEGFPGSLNSFLKTGSTARAWCLRGPDTQ